MEPLQKALQALRLGKMIIVTDGKNRENEGDFIMAAEFATPQKINFMITHGRGLVCLPITQAAAKRLKLSPMVNNNTSKHTTNFTVSIDAKQKITTGISVFDRARTIKLAVQEKSKASHFVRPGHIFPLIANPGGVRKRPGHTEAAIDLLKLASLKPVGVLCEILDTTGRSANSTYLKKLALKFSLPLLSIADLKKILKK